MTVGRINITPRDLIPAAFIGSPAALILPGVLLHFVPIGWALLAGAVIGLAAGLALFTALRSA
jgi:hypothetical protein